MKKIISLILVLCMLASLTVPVFAEKETATFYGTTSTERTNSMEWILATDGDTQTFVKTAAGTSGYKVSTESESGARWLLYRINIGTGWNFPETTDSTFKFTFYRVYTGNTTVHILPSSKADWNKASTASGGLTGEDKFAVPVLTGEEAKGTYTASSNAYNKSCSVKLSADVLNECYDKEEGYLYMVVAVSTTATTNPALLRASDYVSDDKYHTLTINADRSYSDPNLSFEGAYNVVSIEGNNAIVTTNAGKGTAKLIAASYEGNKVTGVSIHDINSTDAEKGQIAVDISSVLSGSKFTKAFLWADDMITPLANVAERTFKMKQETFAGANQTNSEYSEFYSMAEPAFIIPGLNQSVVPQGVTYREETNQFYLSGYFKSGAASVICAIDADTGEIDGEYYLRNEDGSVYDGHVGGIAMFENNLYISHGCYVYRISLDELDALGYFGDLYIKEKINLSVGELSNENNRGCSYVDCSNGYLWVGNYYQAGSTSYDTPIHEDYNALIRAYKLDVTQPNGFALENKTENTDGYDYVPEVMYYVSQQKIQGATTSGDSLILSSSSGASAGKLYVYDRTETVSETVMLMDEDTEVPVISLSPKKTVSIIPYSEDMVVVGDNVYITFESGAANFRNDDGSYPTDSVWKVDLNKLLGIESEEPETPVEPEEPVEKVKLTLANCDEAGETEYTYGEEVTLVTPTKTAKTVKYTFTGWTDGEKTYNAGDVITIEKDMTLTATWSSEPVNGIFTVEFNDKRLVKIGYYDETTGITDNTVKSITSGTTGTVNINARNTTNSSGYTNRPYLFVKADLKNEAQVEKVLLNLKGSSSGSGKIYAYSVSGYPAVGDEIETGTLAVTYTINSTTTGKVQSLDITEFYNNAVGSELYLKIYGWYGNDKRYANAVTLSAESVSLTASTTEEEN